jgi:hypothetical protein
VELPKNWADLIYYMVPRQPPIIVIDLEQHNFLHFRALLRSFYVIHKVNTHGDAVFWQKIRCITDQITQDKYYTSIPTHLRRN